MNLEDFRQRARRRLPAPIFHYLDGGADDEWTLEENTRAFADYRLVPQQLKGVAHIDTATRLLGTALEWPVFLAPTGMSRLFHHAGEIAVARAAAAAGTLYALSTVGTASIETIGALTAGPKMFQIYIFKDRGLTREFVARCKDAGYDLMCLTVDTPRAGNRERDYRTGMTLPPRFTPASLVSFATHPYWSYHLLTGERFSLANVAHRNDALAGGTMSLIDYIDSQLDRDITWRDVEWLAGEWPGPLVVKGLQAADDAVRAREAGARGVMISNHGGRQLDGAPAAIDCLVPMLDAVGDDLEFVVDGGVRRGNHVVKALALGARACSIGRPYLYGLAAGGEAGVSAVLATLRAEVERTMALVGARSVGELSRAHLAVKTRLVPPG